MEPRATDGSLPRVWLAVCLLAVPCLFYMPAVDYLNIPRDSFWLGSGGLLLAWLMWADRLSMAMLAFLAWAAASSLWAWQPQLSWLRLGQLLAAYGTFALARSLPPAPARFLLGLLALQGLLGGLLGLLQWRDVQPFDAIPQTEHPGLTMGHRNVAAEYVLLCLGASAAIACAAWKALPGAAKPWTWAFLGASLLAELAVLGVIRCRGVLLGLGVAAVAAVVLLARHHGGGWLRRLAHPVVLPLLLAGLLVASWMLASGRLGYGQAEGAAKENSFRMRLAHYSNTLMLARDRLPQGVGLGNFALAYTGYIHAWVPDVNYSDRLILRNTHSDPLECLAELGPVGLLLALHVAWLVFLRLPSDGWGDRMLKLALLAQAVNACVNFPLQTVQTLLATSLVLGLLARGKVLGTVRILPFPASVPAKALASVLLCFYLGFLADRLHAHVEARLGLELMVARAQPKAEPHLREAVRLAPRDTDLLMLLAYCLKETGHIPESSSLAENVLGIFPGYLPAINLIGINALEINDLNRACRAFEKSHALQPHQEATRQKLAITYRKQSAEFQAGGFLEQALAAERKLTALYPERMDSHFVQVLDLLLLGRVEEAGRTYDALPAQVAEPRYHYLGACLAMARKDLILAAERIDRGLVLAPGDKDLLLLREALLQAEPEGPGNPEER